MRAVGAAVLLVLLALAHRAAAEPASHRRVAVLEFRGGSAELPGVGGQVAAFLRQHTGLAVLDTDGLRARHPDLESELSRCDGEARCVAKLGARAGAAEVLLVGVAEFGDVILTLQRIDVKRGTAVARVAEVVAPGAPPADRDIEAYVRRVLPESDFRRFGIIRIAADIAGAQVTVGGRARGTTPVAPLRVPAPASYDIRIEKAGHIGFRASVAVPPDAEVLVRAELAEASARPWYARWWVLAAGGAVVVGGVAAAVILTRDDSDDVPVRVNPF
jgi:hypothetical protein